MNLTAIFTRIFFVLLMVVLMSAKVGIGLGAAFGCALVGFDWLFSRNNLRSFNLVALGLFAGYFMAQALGLAISLLFHAPLAVDCAILFSLYLGVSLTFRAANELSICLPFVRFSSLAEKKKLLLVDVSILEDGRIVDLAASGLIDHQLVLPRFLLKELQAEPRKRALETIKKLEQQEELGLQYNETDFPEIQDTGCKLLRLARLIDAHILTAEHGKLQVVENVKMINIHSLSQALKPLMQSGETMKVKIQRYGKEPRQGVGYLEDGTMVVVNGGGEYLGEIIETKVLSVKHSSSGRMIFCNAHDEESHYIGCNEEH